jgi:MEMO1 family protein
LLAFRSVKNKIVIILGLIVILLSIRTIFYIKNYIHNNNVENKNMEEKIIRLPAVSGAFYPEKKDELLKMLAGFFASSTDKNISNIKAIIVPHAGYVYSGYIAANGFKQIENYKNIERVIVIGPSHHEYLNNLGLSHADVWQTPLGQIELDKDFINKLDAFDGFDYNDTAHEQEHSVEVEIPFLQTIIKNNWKLVPIVAGVVSDENIKSSAKNLNSIIDDKTLLVISSDLSHYYTRDVAKKLDQKCIDSITSLNFDKKCEACGEIGIKLLIEIAKLNNWKSEIIKYGDSGDASGDNSQVVGYLSAIFMKNSSAEALAKADKDFLLNLARETIEYAFKNNGKMLLIDENTVPDNLKEKRGVFVTLNENNSLRGCIGYIEPVEKLYKAVQLNAISASFHDTRFNPLVIDELKSVKIEISILTIPQETEFKNIKKNIDGVVLSQGRYGATYLPQVWENVKNSDEFFGSLCQKAGLEWDCYKNKETKFSTYQAEVFEE